MSIVVNFVLFVPDELNELNDAIVIQSLRDELPANIVKADEMWNDFNPKFGTLQWWKHVSRKGKDLMYIYPPRAPTT